MELAAAVTVWITFSAWLFLPTVDAPARFSRIALWLCGAELLAAAIWSYGSAGCEQEGWYGAFHHGLSLTYC